MLVSFIDNQCEREKYRHVKEINLRTSNLLHEKIERERERERQREREREKEREIEGERERDRQIEREREREKEREIEVERERDRQIERERERDDIVSLLRVCIFTPSVKFFFPTFITKI